MLVGRESAHLLKDALGAMMASGEGSENSPALTPVTVDFQGIGGIAPSFLDELISVFESFVGTGPAGGRRGLIIASPPTRLSLKFEAVARGHGMVARALPDGSWLLTDA